VLFGALGGLGAAGERAQGRFEEAIQRFEVAGLRPTSLSRSREYGEARFHGDGIEARLTWLVPG
jgi:hypothetical protein